MKKYGISFGLPIVSNMIANPIAGKIPPAIENPEITQSGKTSRILMMASVPNRVKINTGTKRRTTVISSGYKNAHLHNPFVSPCAAHLSPILTQIELEVRRI